MTLPVYTIRLGRLALRLRGLPSPPPSSWILHAVPSAETREVSADVSFSHAPAATIEERAREVVRAVDVAERCALDATHPVTGITDAVSWIGDDSLLARRGGTAWALLEFDAPERTRPPASSTARARVLLSAHRPAEAALAFFDTLMPFLVARTAITAGGLLMHGNALLMPPSSARPRRAILLTGPSGSGKSTLSRLLARDRTDTQLVAEDRVLVLPVRPPTPAAGSSAAPHYAVAPYPTAGERWLRSEAAARTPNRLVAVIAVEPGRENRLRAADPGEGFARFWEQAFPPLVAGAHARLLVDSAAGILAKSPLKMYAFLKEATAASILRMSCHGATLGLKAAVGGGYTRNHPVETGLN